MYESCVFRIEQS